MPTQKVKTIVLYDKRKVQPETVEKLRAAKDGDYIPLEPDELRGNFTVLQFPLDDELPKRQAPKPSQKKEVSLDDLE